MAIMMARYDGTCCECSGAIRAGTEIHWAGRGQASHRACHEGDSPTKAKAEVCCECGAKSTNASWPCTMSPDGEGDHDWVTDYAAEGDRQMARWMQNDVG